MRNPIPFDTHAFVKRMAAVGVPEAQAEAHVENLAEIVANLVTKDDLLAAKEELRQVFSGLETRSNECFARVERSIAELDPRLTIKVGLMIAAAIGILTAIQRLYPALPIQP